MWSVDAEGAKEHAFVRRIALLGTSWLSPSVLPTQALLAWRLLACLYLASCGFWGTFVLGPDVHWGPSWHVENPPVVYLTNWGFTTLCAYMVLATCGSYLVVRDDLDPNLNQGGYSFASPLFRRTHRRNRRSSKLPHNRGGGGDRSAQSSVANPSLASSRQNSLSTSLLGGASPSAHSSSFSHSQQQQQQQPQQQPLPRQFSADEFHNHQQQLGDTTHISIGSSAMLGSKSFVDPYGSGGGGYSSGGLRPKVEDEGRGEGGGGGGGGFLVGDVAMACQESVATSVGKSALASLDAAPVLFAISLVMEPVSFFCNKLL
jgi:hypothetical protein